MNNLFQKLIHSPKLLALAGLTLISIILIIYAFTSPKKTGLVTIPSQQATAPTPTPIIGQLSLDDPNPGPSLTIKWTNKSIDIPDTLNIYTINTPLINPQNATLYAQKLGFSGSYEQESVDPSLRSWLKGEASLSTNFQDNELTYNSGNIPLPQKQNYAEDSYTLTANNLLKNVFGDIFSKTLIKQAVAYLKYQGFYTVQASQEEASLIRVTFYQSIQGYPLANISNTGAIVSVILDKNLSLNGLIVKDASESYISIGNSNTVPLSDLVATANTSAIRINASDYSDLAIDTISAKNIIFNQATAQVGYLFYHQQLVPVYLLEGKVKTSVTTEQPGVFALPATK